jgi:hypothetical protein
MAEIRITVPDAWAAGLTDAINDTAERIQRNAVAEKAMAAWGKTFDQLTQAEKVRLVIIFGLWQIKSRYDVDAAAAAAQEAAAQAAVDEFTP